MGIPEVRPLEKTNNEESTTTHFAMSSNKGRKKKQTYNITHESANNENSLKLRKQKKKILQKINVSK